MKKNSTIFITGGTGSFGNTFVPMTLKKFQPKSILINNANVMHSFLKMDGYNEKPRAGTTVYVAGGLTKVIPISHFKEFCIHHLPNKYITFEGDYDGQAAGNFGTPDNVMQRQLKTLME